MRTGEKRRDESANSRAVREGERESRGMEGKIVHQTEKIAGTHCGCLADGRRDTAKTKEGAPERERESRTWRSSGERRHTLNCPVFNSRPHPGREVDCMFSQEEEFDSPDLTVLLV